MTPVSYDPWWKRLEIGLRRSLIRTLGRLTHRSTAPPTPPDILRAKVLLIRQDRIGDVLVSTPLIAGLRHAFPEMTIDMLASTNNAAAVASNPDIRRIWTYVKRLGPTIRMIREIRTEQYDFAVDLMDNPSATGTAFCLLSGARWTIGLEKANDYAYDLRARLLSRKDVHIVRRIAELARPFGVDPESAAGPIVFRPTASERKAARSILGVLGESGEVTVGINISAGSENRFWGIEKFRAFLAEARMQLPHALFVILAKPEDADRAAKIAEDFPQACVAPSVRGFGAFAALVERMDLLITPDTSAVHLGAAFSIPSLVLYIQTDPDLRIWDPHLTPHESVITSTNEISEISLDDVVTAFRRLLRHMPTEAQRSQRRSIGVVA